MVTVIDRPDRRCGATNRQGERCGNFAIRGARVCRFHGGAVKRTKAAAARRVAEQQAFESLARHKAAPVDNPLEAFRQLAGEVIAVKDWLGGIVERIEEVRYQGGSGEQLRGELQAYTSLLDQCRRVLADYGRLNIDERLAGITQRQARLVADVTAFALRTIGLADEDVATVRRMYAVLLRMAGPAEFRLPDDPEHVAAVARLHARITTPDRTAALEVEIGELRAELEAVVGQRDDLLDALRRNRSGPPLAIEAPKPPEVVVERESIVVPDVDVADAERGAPSSAPRSRSGGARMRFRSSASVEPDAWDGYRRDDGRIA